jgi:hypothetical protein
MMSTTLDMYAFVVQIWPKGNLEGVYLSQQSPSAFCNIMAAVL